MANKERILQLDEFLQELAIFDIDKILEFLTNNFEEYSQSKKNFIRKIIV